MESYAVFLPTLREAFQWAQVEATVIYAILQLGVGITAFPIGRLYDAWGPRRTFSLGFLSLGLAMLLASQATSHWHFAAAIGLFGGIGAVALGPIPGTALVSSWYHRRPTFSIGLVWAASGFGVLGMAPGIQLLIREFGWQTAYLVLGIGFALIPGILSPLPWRRIAAGRGDAKRGEQKIASPMPTQARFRNVVREPALWSVGAIYFFTAIGMFAVHPQIVSILLEAGFSDIVAATAFGIAGMVNVAGVIALAYVADRPIRLIGIICSYTLSILGIVFLVPLLATTSVVLLWVFLFCFGGTMAARGPVLAATVANLFGARGGVGTVVGVTFGFSGIGGAIGTTLGGLLRDLSGSYVWTLGFAATILLIPLALFCIVPELRRGRASPKRPQ